MSSLRDPGAPGAGALACLRAATARRHAAVDALIDAERLHEPGRRARVLQAMATFLPPWEAAVQAALPTRLRHWAAAAPRQHWLRQDLAELHAAPLAARVPPLAVASPAAALGSLYVMEGSALGGRVLAQRIAAAGEELGLAYFRGWGEATGERWRECRAWLASELADDATAIGAACDAACATFDALAAVLRESLDGPLAPESRP